uniref:BPTI/Kunitz inhibitor domain-containing protein n=1 Tax=Romanomermis culicivorax TaxID=13658 RepID=A0A915KGA7_ROMCU
MGENAPPSNLTSVDQSGHNALYLDLKEQAGCYDIPDSATSGFCPDNTLPLGGQYPLICGDSKDSVTCPDGYICVPGIVQVCCLRPTTYKVDESVPEKYRAKAPKFSPRAPGVAPYLAQPQSNALSFADIRILRAQYERMAAERDGEKAMFKKPSRVDVGKSQKFVVSSAVAPSNNASVEIDKTSVQLVENPYNNGENSQSTDNSDNTYLLRPPPPNAGNLTNTVEELEPVALNPNFFNRPLSPTSFLACPDGAEPLKDARTGKPQDCILDSNNNPLCARGQYCHIDLESKTRFCCDISSRAGFGEVSSNNKDNESQPAHKRVLGASACLGGRCRPISQSWFHGSDSAEQTTSATPETVTLPNTKRETKDEINPYTTNSSSQDGNADYKRVIYTGYAPARNTFGLASSILRIPDKAVNTSSLAANNVRQHDDGTFDLKPSSYDKRCYLPPNQGLECPNAENTKLSTNVFYYFIVEEQRCNLFFYKGCQGNENRFSSREKCLQACGRGLSAAEKL